MGFQARCGEGFARCVVFVSSVRCRKPLRSAWPWLSRSASCWRSGLVVARIGRLGVGTSLLTAAVRACVQLAAVSVVIAAVLGRTWLAVLFALMMFVVATATAAGRVGARRDWTWIAVALGAGVVPVLAIIFGLRVTEVHRCGGHPDRRDHHWWCDDRPHVDCPTGFRRVAR